MPSALLRRDVPQLLQLFSEVGQDWPHSSARSALDTEQREAGDIPEPNFQSRRGCLTQRSRSVLFVREERDGFALIYFGDDQRTD